MAPTAIDDTKATSKPPSVEGEARLPYIRRSTEPASPSSPSPSSAVSSLPLRPRNHSPFARAPLRSRSSAGSLSAPVMTRAHSSPATDVAGHILRPSSPHGATARRRSPLRRPSDEGSPSYGGYVDIGETIAENSELDLTPRASMISENLPSSPLLPIHHTFPRSRRRPSSPLHNIMQSSQTPNASSLRTSTSSPSLASAAKFNEPYPSTYSMSPSSLPSTPTSFRSRSPSMSSLETIPDSPDAEQAAIEAYNIARLKAAADREGEIESGVRRRGSLEVPEGAGSLVLAANGFGIAYGGRDKRKRWSVCGAERRGDLDLETIWED